MPQGHLRMDTQTREKPALVMMGTLDYKQIATAQTSSFTVFEEVAGTVVFVIAAVTA